MHCSLVGLGVSSVISMVLLFSFALYRVIYTCVEIWNYRAAYKGFADCIRLLLFLDAYRGRQDKEGIILSCH